MSWLKLFKTKISKIPKTGEEWELKRDNDGPWAITAKPVVVRILDVRDGWVRYYINSVFPDERKKVSWFTDIYEKK